MERQTWAERGTLLSGGFLDIVKRFSPRVEPFAAVRFAVLINGLFLSIVLRRRDQADHVGRRRGNDHHRRIVSSDPDGLPRHCKHPESQTQGMIPGDSVQDVVIDHRLTAANLTLASAVL